MCGLLGIYGQKIDKNVFVNALNLQKHRGPDDYGYFENKSIQLGHRRLSIIDLSSRSKQPMSSEDGRITVVFNGEIFNFKELRDSLKKKGYKFKTYSDTEVLLNSYHYYKEKCLDLFIGMFAFAIYDANDDSIFIARDRLGVKPLYYKNNGMFVFSSEIKSILKMFKNVSSIDLNSVSSYLSFRSPSLESTFFNEIKQLAPAHYIKYKNKNLEIVRYWDLSKSLSLSRVDKGEIYYKEKLMSLLESSVQYRMISDVPIGSYLSGGVDSSAIVSIMSNSQKLPVNTYTIGLKDANEFDYAKIISQQYNTIHCEMTVSPNDYLSTTQKMIDFKDSPIGVPNEVFLYLMSRKLKNKATVVLTGEGADEIFGGYGRIFRSTDDYIKSLNLANGIYKGVQEKKIKESLKNTYGRIGFKNEVDHFMQKYQYIVFQEKKAMFNKDINIDLIEEEIRRPFVKAFKEVSKFEYMSKIMYVFEKLHLPVLLNRVDSATMAASVEARVPFVDHRLVEFAFSIPNKYKLKWLVDPSEVEELTGDKISEKYDTPKYILKKTLEDRIPNKILYRKKVGFPVPIDKIMLEKNKKMVKDLIMNGALLRTIFNRKEVERLFQSGTTSYNKIWSLFNLEVFHSKYFDL